MKTFAEYLTESKKTFDYRVKLVGDVDKEFINKLETRLAEFDIVKMTDPKVTPVMKTLPDFPACRNERITHFDVSFNYPATQPQLEQVVKLLGGDPNRVCMQQQSYADSLDAERDIMEKNAEVTSEFPEETKAQKAAKEEHAADPMDHDAVKNHKSSTDFTIEGGNTPDAKTSNDVQVSTTSPISGSNKLPTVGE